MEEVLVQYLKHLHIPVSKKYCEKIIVSHPDYPSLLSVSDALERLGIPCQVGRIKEQYLSKVEFPFLIHLENSREGLVLIKSKKDLAKEHIDLTQWKGIVLKAEPVKEIKNSEHEKEYKSERLMKNIALALTVSLFGMLLIPILQTFSWPSLLLLITAIPGFSLGYVLIAKDLGITYKPVESFCNTSTHVNCDKILHSEGARIVSFFGLSDAVTSYFAFQLILAGILMPFLNIAAPYLWVLITGSALSIPIMVYSIYYQAIKVRTWCRLCMLVNAIFAAQVVFFGISFIKGIIPVQSIELIPFVFSFFLILIIGASVVLIKDKFQKINNAVNAEVAATRLKNDPDIFSSLLLQGQKVDTGTFDKKMIIGSPDSPVQLIMVASLHCYPCKLAFEHVLALVEDFPNQIGIEFRFVMSAGHQVHGIPASTWLIQYWEQCMYGKKDQSLNTKKLIHDWYAYMNAAEFEAKYLKVPSIAAGEEDGLELRHFQWTMEHKITRTPTFFLNGYPFPSKYTVKDVANLMPGLEASIYEQVEKHVTHTNELVKRQDGPRKIREPFII